MALKVVLKVYCGSVTFSATWVPATGLLLSDGNCLPDATQRQVVAVNLIHFCLWADMVVIDTDALPGLRFRRRDLDFELDIVGLLQDYEPVVAQDCTIPKLNNYL